MKNTLKTFTALAAMALAAAMTLTACDKDKPAPEQGVTITGGQQTQTVFADKNNGTSEVKFETTGAWTSSITEGVPTRAEADTRATAVWVSISPSSGTKAGDYTIDITLDDNYTGADRTATITITSGGDSITITVTQKAVTESGEKPVETVAVTGVTLNKSTLALVEGATETLTATIAPDNATDEAVTWKSSDEAVATVDANGKVTAVASGSATITVTSTADATKTATCEVTVTATTTTVPVTGVSLDKSTLALVEGATETLTATIAPATATDKAITWKSDKPDIADVDDTGKVTAVKAGTATITATSAADATQTARCAVTVSAPAPTENTFVVGSRTAVMLPSESFMEWYGHDTNPAAEEMIVRLVSGDGLSACFTLTLPDGNQRLAPGTYTYHTGDAATAPANRLLCNGDSFVYDNTADAMVGYFSAGTLTVSVSGTGDAAIYTIAVDCTFEGTKGKFSGTYRGTLTWYDESPEEPAPAQSVQITGSSLNVTLTAGDTLTFGLTTTGIADGTYPATFEWYDGSISTGVSGTATISGGKGTLTVATTAATPAGSDMFRIIIDGTTSFNHVQLIVKAAPSTTVPVTGVTVSPTTLTIRDYEEANLTATVLPANATNKNVTWTSGDEAIATVDANGKVTAVKGGTVTITVTSAADATKTATCEVTVQKGVVNVEHEGVTLNNSSLWLDEGETYTLVATVKPHDATDKRVVWSSSHPEIASVDDSGLVRARKVGTAIITVVTFDGAHSDACTVKVEEGDDVTDILPLIPDESFRAYCQAWDTDKDGKLSPQEAATVKSVSPRSTISPKIASLEGIEYLTGLTELELTAQAVTSIDLSSNTALVKVKIERNSPLKSLNVSNLTALTTLDCARSALVSLDVSGCTALTTLHLEQNALTALDVSDCTALTSLNCTDNKLTSLDVSRNAALEVLECGRNSLKDLYVWANTSLTKLVCIINEISSLNLSNNPALTYLNCSHNKLTSLDISNNTALTYMGCSQNPGDSVSRFPIYAWFDNDSKPANFQKPLWTYEVKPGEFKDIIPHYSIKIR